MQILVQEKVIETKEIADIVDIEAGKKMFLNREAGFKIIFINNTTMDFKENIPYESTPNDIFHVKQKWGKLKEQVTQQWQSDKTELKTFKIES